MNPEKVKLYLEVIKTLTAFTIGTSAGRYSLIIQDKVTEYYFFFYFLLILDMVSLSMLFGIVLFVDRNA